MSHWLVVLLDAGHIHSGYSQPWAIGAGSANDRPWVVSGDAFGLMAWTTADQAYELFYKDDDARGIGREEGGGETDHLGQGE